MTNTDWTVEFLDGGICRSIMWNGKEVAHINPRGDFDDRTEMDLCAGFAFAGKMHQMLNRLRESGELTEIRLKEVVGLLNQVADCHVPLYVDPEDEE